MNFSAISSLPFPLSKGSRLRCLGFRQRLAPRPSPWVPLSVRVLPSVHRPSEFLRSVPSFILSLGRYVERNSSQSAPQSTARIFSHWSAGLVLDGQHRLN